MTTLQNGDSFLVQRTDSQSGISTNYQVSQENLMANLADDDLLLVQRTSAGISTNYCISGSDLKEDLGGPDGLIVTPVEVLTPINGAGITEFDQYEPLSSAITTVGESGTIAKDTDEIQSVVDEASIVSWDIADGSSPSFANTDINFATELAVKGVTAITGINLYLDGVSGYPYTSSLAGFTLNNVDLVAAAQISLIQYNGTPYNSNYSWVSFFNGGGYNQCQGSTTYTCRFHPRSLGTVAKLKVLSVGGRVSLLDQDGVEHFIIGSSPNKILSFPTNTNFSGLSVGDVVQGNGLNGTASVTQGYTFTDGRGNLDNLFNGVVAGNGTASSDYLNHLVQPNDAGGLPCTLTFDPPLSARSGTLKAYVTRYSAGNVNYTINGSEGHSVYAASNPVEDDTGVTSISTFTFDSNTGNAQLWGFADGNGVLEHVDNVTVTTINASATPPTVTVDGGTWTTSDRLTGQVSYEKSLTFTNTTELANMVAPLEMVDATGSNSLTPTTSNVVSTSFTPSASFFNTTTYTGDGSVNVQNFVTGVDIQNNGGMIWFKSRTSGQAARILDTYRGTLSSLIPSSTGAGSNLGADGLTFNDDGFSIGWEGSDIAGANDYVAWSFREAPGFFDIVTWTGNGSSREIPHNLGSVPGMILIKMTSDSDSWQVYHKGIGETHYLSLNYYSSANASSSRWNDTAPTDSVFTIGNDNGVNQNGKTFVAYLFADNPSKKIKCGSYTGTGSPGNVIDLGFEPKFFMVKRTDSDINANWIMVDAERGMPASGDASYLMANEPDSDFGRNIQINPTSTGVVINESGQQNESNGNYVYMAIGEAGTPDTTELTFQDNTALSALTSGMTVTSNAASTGLSFSTTIYSGNSTHTGSGAEQVITTGVDNVQKSMIWFKNRSGSSDHKIFDTLRTPPDHRWLTPNKNWDELDEAAVLKDRTTSGFTVVHPTSGSGVGATNPNDNEPDMVAWNFRAEPGFFDIVTWDGNNTNREIAHNLGSVPGFIMVKRYSANEDWTCYHKSLGATNYMQLNGTARSTNFSLIFNNTEPTSTHFTVGTHDRVNTTGQSYIAYVFADNPSKGIKCGVYSGNSSAQTIDTGFETGWVMVKQSTNDYKDWVIVDNVRGGGSGNTGKGLAANSDGQEFATNLDFVSTGFELFDGSSEVNTSGQDYIYIAIAANPILLGAQAIASLTADADPSTNTASVAAAAWPTGDSVTGPSLSASLTSILEVSGNTIFGNGSTGTWMSGYYAEGSQVNDAPPGPSEITFTSQNQGTPGFSGVDATLASRTWTLESGASATGPWTVVDSYVDYDALNSQDGATPWSSNKPTLQPNTYYRIKVQYNSTNAESVESVYHTFKTGDA